MLYNFVVISMLTFIMNTESILFHRCWYEENSLQWIMYGPIVVSICVSKYLFYPIVLSSFRIGDLYLCILFRTIPLQRGRLPPGQKKWSSLYLLLICQTFRRKSKNQLARNQDSVWSDMSFSRLDTSYKCSCCVQQQSLTD